MASTIVASVVARIFDVGVERGVPKAMLTGIVGRPRSALVADARVAIDTTFECLAACLRHTKDPGFPLHVARAVTTEDYSVLGFALMTSDNAAQAFERLVRYGHLISDSGTWRATDTARAIELLWVRSGSRTLGHRAANECAVAELVGGLRRSYGAAFVPKRVFFRHAAPTITREHTAYFGAPIEWASTKEGVLLGRDILPLRPSGENPAMSRFFGDLLETRARDQTCEARVRQALVLALSSGTPSAGRTAAALGMSERSLRRALSEEGTSYRDLLDDLRKTVAVDMLRAKKSVTEIAFLLGFSETSALSRAFRRWYGTSARSVLRSL